MSEDTHSVKAVDAVFDSNSMFLDILDFAGDRRALATDEDDDSEPTIDLDLKETNPDSLDEQFVEILATERIWTAWWLCQPNRS